MLNGHISTIKEFESDQIPPKYQYAIDFFLTIFGVALSIFCTTVTAYDAYAQLSSGQSC